MSEGNSHLGYGESLRHQVFKELGKNPLLTAKPLCKLLGLNFKQYEDYVKKLKHEWKGNHEKGQGSICSIVSSVHCWRGFAYVPKQVNLMVVKSSLPNGWVQSRSRNRFLLWKDGLGHIEWFETNRINLYVRKPASLGRAYQLVCNGFFKTGLISDVKVLEGFLRTVRFKSAHFVFETGQRLPKLTIGLFDETNGVTIKVGDRSDPRSVEVIAEYMRQFEVIDLFLQGLARINDKQFFDLRTFGVV